jgi:hypothetical protein
VRHLVVQCPSSALVDQYDPLEYLALDRAAHSLFGDGEGFSMLNWMLAQLIDFGAARYECLPLDYVNDEIGTDRYSSQEVGIIER